MPTLSKPINFQYKKVGDKTYRPIIPIELEYTNKLRYEVLIDSGADVCIFDAEIAEAIGIEDITTGKPGTFTGVTGKPAAAYEHTVTIKIKNCSFRARVNFTEHIVRSSYGIVGQKGFFDRFAITFDYPGKTIVLTKKDWV